MKRPDLKFISRLLVIVLPVLVILYDLLPIFSKEDGDTISEVIMNHTTRNPFVVFMVGALVFHLFVPANPVSHYAYDLAVRHPWIPLLAGALTLGMCFWAQVRQ